MPNKANNLHALVCLTIFLQCQRFVNAIGTKKQIHYLNKPSFMTDWTILDHIVFSTNTYNWNMHSNRLQYPLFSKCSNISLFGGYHIFGGNGGYNANDYASIEKLYVDIPPHDAIRIRMGVFFIDQQVFFIFQQPLTSLFIRWKAFEFQVFVDSNVVFNKTYNKSDWQIDQCAESSQDNFEFIDFFFLHSNSNITVMIQAFNYSGIINGCYSWGIHQFSIFYYKCSASCDISSLCVEQNEIVNNATTCQRCHSSCATCNKPASLQDCLTCATGFSFNTSFSQVCQPDPCNSSSILVYSEGCIFDCHITCITCTGPAANECLSCQKFLNREFNSTTNSCNCMTGYYQIDEIVCGACHFSCFTCYSFERDACLSCDFPSSNLVLVNKQCLCPEHFFSLEGNQSCLQCHSTCLNCSDGSQNSCTACDNTTNNRRLVINKCLCIDHYFPASFDEGNNPACLLCHYSCAKCYAGEANNCIDCPASRILINLDKCICPNGFFEVFNDRDCYPCQLPCSTCTVNASHCTQCASDMNLILSANNASCVCQDAYYLNPINNICESCQYSCATCYQSKLQCITCPPDTNRLSEPDQNQTCRCLDGFLDYQQLRKCVPCYYQCATCKNSSPYLCLTCHAVASTTTTTSELNREDFSLVNNSCPCKFGFYDEDSLYCKPCAPQCLTCQFKSKECTSCPVDSFREFIDGLGINFCPCLQGYFDIGLPMCKQCSPSCKTCEITADRCTSCISQKNLQFNKCLCKDTYFEDSLFGFFCQPCADNCLTCINTATYCLSCSATEFLTLNHATHECVCDAAIFRKSQLSTSSDSSKIKCVCDDDHYQNSNNQCIPLDLFFNISIHRQQFSANPYILITFNDVLSTDEATFKEQLIVKVQNLQSQQYSLDVQRLDNKTFQIIINIKIDVPAVLDVVLDFKNILNIRSMQDHSLNKQYIQNKVKTQICPYIIDPMIQSLCSLSQKFHKSEIFKHFIRIFNLMPPLLLFSSSFQLVLVFLMMNTILPVNFYCLLRTMAPFVGLNLYISNWQEITLESTRIYTFFGIQIKEAYYQSSPFFNRSFRDMGLSISFLSNFEYQIGIQIIVLLFLLYYRCQYTQYKKGGWRSYRLMIFFIRLFGRLFEGNFTLNMVAILIDLSSGNFQNSFRVYSFLVSLFVLSMVVWTYIRALKVMREQKSQKEPPLIFLDFMFFDLKEDNIAIPLGIDGGSKNFIKYYKHVRCFHLYTFIKKTAMCIMIVFIAEPKLQTSMLIVVQAIFIIVLVFFQPYKYPCLTIVKCIADIILLICLVITLVYTCTSLAQFEFKAQYYSYNPNDVTDMESYGSSLCYIFILYIIVQSSISIFWIRQYCNHRQKKIIENQEKNQNNYIEINQHSKMQTTVSGKILEMSKITDETREQIQSNISASLKLSKVNKTQINDFLVNSSIKTSK